jgi:type II secretory pathway pseudopilin PulG
VLEVAVVVVVIALLVSVAIPLLHRPHDQTVDLALDADRRRLQSAIDLYTHQHEGVSPGLRSHVDGAPVGSPAEARDAFVAQLTRSSDLRGRTAASRDGTFRFGPYLPQGIPQNPRTGTRGVVCVLGPEGRDLSASEAERVAGWTVWVRLGRVVPTDVARTSAAERADRP